MSDWTKSKKDLSNIELGKMSNGASKFLGGLLGDINARSAYSQMLIGVGSGWLTGFFTMKIGKVAAFTIGSGIILLEIAHQEGFIAVDWSKINKKLDKVSERVETAVAGREDNWIEKGTKFAKGNPLVVSFIGGVFIGLASA